MAGLKPGNDNVSNWFFILRFRKVIIISTMRIGYFLFRLKLTKNILNKSKYITENAKMGNVQNEEKS